MAFDWHFPWPLPLPFPFPLPFPLPLPFPFPFPLPWPLPLPWPFPLPWPLPFPLPWPLPLLGVLVAPVGFLGPFVPALAFFPPFSPGAGVGLADATRLGPLPVGADPGLTDGRGASGRGAGAPKTVCAISWSGAGRAFAAAVPPSAAIRASMPPAIRTVTRRARGSPPRPA